MVEFSHYSSILKFWYIQYCVIWLFISLWYCIGSIIHWLPGWPFWWHFCSDIEYYLTDCLTRWCSDTFLLVMLSIVQYFLEAFEYLLFVDLQSILDVPFHFCLTSCWPRLMTLWYWLKFYSDETFRYVSTTSVVLVMPLRVSVMHLFCVHSVVPDTVFRPYLTCILLYFSVECSVRYGDIVGDGEFCFRFRWWYLMHSTVRSILVTVH